MKEHKIGKVTFRSRCAAALALLKHTKMTNAAIARRCQLTDAAVSIMNKKYKVRPVRQYDAITA